MANLLKLLKPIIIHFATNSQVKLLVIQLLQKYVNTTDNSIDDVILGTVKAALFKDQITGITYSNLAK